jgi:hypothetical protein
MAPQTTCKSRTNHETCVEVQLWQALSNEKEMNSLDAMPVLQYEGKRVIDGLPVVRADGLAGCMDGV